MSVISLVQRVEGVEELLLEALLALEELDVVDEQDVVGAVALLEALDPLVAERVDEVVDEGLARHVAHGERGRVLRDVLRHGLQEMRLAKAGAAVDEERVVGLRWRLGDRECSRMREAVGRPDDERVEGVLVLETAAFGPSLQALDHGNGALRPRAILRRATRVFRDPELERALDADDVAHRGADQPEEVPFDPVAGELAWNREHERLVLDGEIADVTEPLGVRPVAERFSEPPRDLLPKVLCRQLDLVLHRRPGPPRLRPGGQHNSGSDGGKIASFAGSFQTAQIPPQVWTDVGGTRSSRIPEPSAAVDKTVDEAWLY
jgi:hypothetical protein